MMRSAVLVWDVSGRVTGAQDVVMRALPIIAMLTLLIAPIGARAQQTGPQSLGRPCPVSADERWTTQEKFVWERVCVGDVADFNTEPGYGGRLDPKKPAAWPQSRVLRPTFLETILLDDKYRRALTRNGVNIAGARFVEKVDLSGAELQHPLVMFGSVLEKGVDFAQVRSRHPIGLGNSVVAVGAEMNGLDLDANLALPDSNFDALNLVSAHVRGQINLQGSKVAGIANMNGLQVDRTLFGTKADFAQGLDLTTAHVSVLDLTNVRVSGSFKLTAGRVDENLHMDGAHFGDADLTGLRVDQHLLMRNAEFATLVLNSTHVGGQLRLSGSRVAGQVTCYRLDVGQLLLMDDGATFNGSIACSAAKIRGDLHLSGGQFSKDIDFTGAGIDGKLVLENVKWSKGITLTLQNASIGSIPDLAPDAWPSKLDVDNLTYRSVGEANDFIEWFEKTDHYAPQPYEQLASVVDSQGKRTLATLIRYSRRERERSEAGIGEWTWLTILKWVIGYGYYPERSAVCALVLVVFGAIVLKVAGEKQPFPLTYSFDMLLPVIHLREEHYNHDLESRARYYFYAQKVLGWVLISFLAAAVSGIAK